jgi:hypothetical protein
MIPHISALIGLGGVPVQVVPIEALGQLDPLHVKLVWAKSYRLMTGVPAVHRFSASSASVAALAAPAITPLRSLFEELPHQVEGPPS